MSFSQSDAESFVLSYHGQVFFGSHTVWRHTLNGDRYCMTNIETLISAHSDAESFVLSYHGQVFFGSHTVWRHTLYGDIYNLATSNTLFSP